MADFSPPLFYRNKGESASASKGVAETLKNRNDIATKTFRKYFKIDRHILHLHSLICSTQTIINLQERNYVSTLRLRKHEKKAKIQDVPGMK